MSDLSVKILFDVNLQYKHKLANLMHISGQSTQISTACSRRFRFSIYNAIQYWIESAV